MLTSVAEASNGMIRLGFVCHWDRNNWQQTWSGTPFSLRAALMEEGANVVDMPLELLWWEEFYLKLFHARYNTVEHRITSMHRISPLTLQLLSRKFTRYMPDELDALLCIGDIVDPRVRRSVPLFSYADAIAASHYLTEQDPLVRPRLSLHHTHRLYHRRIKWQQRFFEEAEKLFFMSRWAQRAAIELLRIDPARTAVAYPGVNAFTEDSLPRPHNRPYILFVGREFRRKCGDLVIKAYQSVRQQFECDLVVAGAPQRYVHTIPDGVYWIGNVPTKQLTSYFMHGELFVMPSIFEAFGLVFIEALSYGVPVIARNVCAAPEFVTHGYNGLLMHPRSESVEELAELIVQGLTDSSLREHARADMHRVRATFNWRRTAATILENITESITVKDYPKHEP